MDLDKLRVFTVAAEQGSFTRAGEQLRLTQPSVSSHVRDLERSLGVPLFERLGRGVRLTLPGRDLFAYAQRIFELEADAVQVLNRHRGAETGKVVVAASSTPGAYVLPRMLAAYRSGHPDVGVEIHVSDTADVGRRLEALSADLGVVGDVIEGMDNQPWMTDELVLVVEGEHPWCGSTKEPGDLQGAPFVWRERGSAVRSVAEEWLAGHDVEVEEIITLEGNEAVKAAVGAGLGMTITTSLAISCEQRAGRLVAIPVDDMPITRQMYLSRHPRKPLVPAAQDMWALLSNI